jgi:hypothetical protein
MYICIYVYMYIYYIPGLGLSHWKHVLRRAKLRVPQSHVQSPGGKEGKERKARGEAKKVKGRQEGRKEKNGT